MAEIAPFRGIRYAPEHVGGLDKVVAPPYDVISPERRAALVERSPLNIVEIDLPTGRGDLKYDHAARLWRRWRADRVLLTDAVPALYLLEETFKTPSGRPGARHGFIGALRLEELSRGGVRAHERTFAEPKADRLKLMRATKANISQVFALYRDPDHLLDAAWKDVMTMSPDAELRMPDGGRRMWMVTDPEVIGLATEVLRNSTITIADGHHRYETAVTYRNECRQRGETGDCDSLMVYFSSMDDAELTILPTHRLVKLEPQTDMAEMRAKLSEYFDLEPVRSDDAGRWLAEMLPEDSGEPYRFGLYCREWGWLVATLRSWRGVAAWINPEKSEAWRHLDVAVLHEVILKRLMGVREQADAHSRIGYTPDPLKGYAEVARGAADLLCMLRPTSARQIAEVADAGDTMPQKSTYFYPKLLTGLVMRSLEG